MKTEAEIQSKIRIYKDAAQNFPEYVTGLTAWIAALEWVLDE